MRELLATRGQRIEHERWRRMLRFADLQLDRRERGIGHHACKQTPQPLEWIRMQAGETGIHVGRMDGNEKHGGGQRIIR